MSKETLVYYAGGTSYEEGIGPMCVCLFTNEWSIMVDCGTEFCQWPQPGTDLSKFHFNTPFEREFIKMIVENDEMDGRRPQELFKTWSRGPALSKLAEWGVKIDNVLLTHSHTDHIGGVHLALPHLAKGARYWGSPHTLDMIEPTQKDGRKLSPYLFDKGARQTREVLARRQSLRLGLNKITPEGVWVGLSGHTPGAVNFGIRLPNGKVVGATGDIAWHKQAMVCESTLPDDLPDEWLYDALIITDFTYPFVRETVYDEDRKGLLDSIIRSYDERNIVVVNTYANAKGVGIASDLSSLGIPVYLDGMTRKVLDICLANQQWAPRYPRLHTSNIRKVRSQKHREEVIGELEKYGGVVVTTSAGGEGPSRRYQKAGLHRSRYHFIYVGWVPDDSVMKKTHEAVLKEVMPTISWSDESGESRLIQVRARIEKRSMSGHGDLKDWIMFLSRLMERRKGRPLDVICISHCLEKAKNDVLEAIKPYAKRIEVVTKENRLFQLY
jgi:Cft2 family RNA processing exonuclease